MKMKLWMASAVLGLWIDVLPVANGANWYVNDASVAGDIYTTSTGNDANSGQSVGSPKLTMGTWLTNVVAGDTVFIDTGSYSPAVITNVHGAPGNRVVFKGSPNGTVFTGSGSGNGLTLSGQFLHLQDLRISSFATGIYIHSTHNSVLERIQISGYSTYGIAWHNGATSSSNQMVNCAIYGAGHNMISWSQGGDNALKNSVFMMTSMSTAYNINWATYTNFFSIMQNCIIGGVQSSANSPAFNSPFPRHMSRNLFVGCAPATAVGTMAEAQAGSTNRFGNTAVSNPMFVNAAELDFHVISAAGYVSNGVWVTNAMVGYSPAIDFGARSDSAWTNEPAPNGGRVNTGFFGGTAEASKSRSGSWTFALSFNDGGNLVQTGRLEWVASSNVMGNVALEYTTNNWATSNLIATVAATNEIYNNWIPTFSHPMVRWRVRDVVSGFASTNAMSFSVRETTNTAFSFYVNDNSRDRDVFCEAIGASGNTGISTNSPKAYLSEIVSSFDLEAGDIVYVDTGTYVGQTTTIGAFDSGRAEALIRIIGSTNGATMNRGSTSANVLDIGGASYLHVENLILTGGNSGLAGNASSNVVMRSIHFTGNQYGVNLTGAAANHTFEKCVAINNALQAFNADTAATVVSRSNLWANGVLWGSPTLIQARTNSLSISNSILGNGTTLFGSQVAPGDYNVVWQISNVGAAQSSFTSLQDSGAGWSNSVYADPRFADASAGDFHLMSPSGRFNPSTGNFVTTDAQFSAAIDAGNPASPVALEPTPNGGRLNAGLFGGTTQASKSRTNAWIQLASFQDGGVLDAQGGAWIRWNAGQFAGGATVNIWLSRDSGTSWEILATNVSASSQHFFYKDDVADDSSSRTALLKVELAGSVPAVTSQSQTNFTYRNGVFAMYINDDSRVGDVYCTAVGNDNNSGTSPGDPMRNLHTLLAKMGQLSANDRVYMDTGVYSATNQIRVTSVFGGSAILPVTIQGSTNRLAGGTLFQRSGAIAQPFGIEFFGVTNFVLRDVIFSNVVRGVAISTNASNVRLENVEVRGASARAFEIVNSSRTNELIRCVANGGGIGLYLDRATNFSISHSIFYENTTNAVFFNTFSSNGIIENNIFASTRTNSALFSVLTNVGFVANYNGHHAGPFTRVGVNRASNGGTADNLAAWQQLTGQDIYSVAGDPQMAAPEQYDYHLKSQETLGRVLPNGNRSSDPVSSPLLDAGNPATSIGEEVAPHGGRVEIGKFGGTREASRALSSPWILPISFADGGSISNAAVRLVWTAGGGLVTQTVAVGVSVDGEKNWTNVATKIAITNGEITWNPAPFSDTPAGAWRVVSESDTNVWARSSTFFSIRKAPLNIYVATADTNETVFVTAPGAADNWQATRSAPQNSLRTVFDLYDLEPGDQVWVDTGTFEETEAIQVGLKDSGTSNSVVRVTGNTNLPYSGTVLKRATRTSGAYVVNLQHTEAVEFGSLVISNAFSGVQLNGGTATFSRVRAGNCVTNVMYVGAGARLNLVNSVVEQSLNYGVLANTGSTVKIIGSLVRDNSLANIGLRGGNIEVKNSVLEASGSRRYNYFYDSAGSLDSDYNNIRVSDGANVAGGGSRSTDRFLIDWQISSGFTNDTRSFGYDANFANANNFDFHLKSQYGRYDPRTGIFTNDAVTSMLIDMGVPSSSNSPYNAFAIEPTPNGARVNVGLYGNSREASKSSGQATIVPLTMSDGGTIRGTSDVYWSWNGFVGNEYVNILFSGDGGLTWTTLATNIYINQNTYRWATTNVDSTAMGVWKVVLASNTNVYGKTETLFAVKNDPLAYFVNDGSMLGDVYCTAIGRATNNGLSASTPLNSLATLLGRYKVDAGDVVYVDTGVYSANVPLMISAIASSTNYLVIQGSTNEAGGGTIFTNTSGGTVLELQNSRFVNLRDLRLHGGNRGMVLSASTSNLIQRVRSIGSRAHGFEIGTQSDQNRFIQCAALNFFQTGLHVVTPLGVIAPVTNYWSFGVISPISTVNTSGMAIATGTLMGALSGRIFVSNSVFVANSLAHNVFDVTTNSMRGNYNAFYRPYSNLFASVNHSAVYFGVSVTRIGNLTEWQNWNFTDTNSFEANPRFADLVAGDLHPQSAGGRYEPSIQSFVTDLVTSPLIDLADPTAAYSNEPAPNGGRANLGVYGNHPLASRTPTNIGTLVLLSLNHGGVVKGTVPLRWFETNITGNVNILISTNSGVTYQATGTIAAAAGVFNWNSTATPSIPTARWKVQSQQNLDWAAESEKDFVVHNGKINFYVNDNSTSNDVFTTAVGALANTGLSPNSPLPSLADVLSRYDLEAGDEVWIDTGVYTSAETTVLESLDSGTAADPVVIQGSPHSAGTLFFIRGIRLDNARGIRLQDLRFQMVPVVGLSLMSVSDVLAERVDVSGGTGHAIAIQNSSNVTVRNFSTAFAASNGVSCAATFNTRLENGTIWSNGFAQVAVRNLPIMGGSTNYNSAFVSMNNCVIGAFGLRNPAIEVRGTLFSDYNNIFNRNAGLAALEYASGFGREFDSVGAWSSSGSRQDQNTLSHEPMFVDAQNRNFHLLSAGGRWNPAVSNWVIDGVTSPLIDAGNPESAFANETAPNGGRINVGRFGNTEQASRTPTNSSLTLVSLNDGGRASGTNVLVKWNARGAIASSGTVSIYYSADGGNSWMLLTSGISASTGAWSWDCSSLEQSVQAKLKIEGSDGSVAISDGRFSVRNSSIRFYVNDGSRTNDVYCTAIGNNSNSGLAPEQPMADLNALLDKYDLEGGDIVFADTGIYQGNVPWRITQADSAGTMETNPVIIQGSTNSLVNGTVLQRNNQAVGIQVDYAVGVQIRNITVSNTSANAVVFNNCRGVSAEWVSVGIGNVGFQTIGGTYLGISNCLAYNVNTGVSIESWDNATNTVFPVIQHNVFWETSDTAIQIGGDNKATVKNNILSVKPNQYIYGLGAQDELISDYNSIWLGNGGRVFQKTYSRLISPVPTIYDTLGAWVSASGQDSHSYDGDPLLVNPTNHLYQLRSRAGRWIQASNTWTNDSSTSPLIDAGDPASVTWTNEPIPNSGRVNIGLYGGTPWASKSDTNSMLHLLTFNRGGVAHGQVPLNWKASGVVTGQTVRIEVSLDNGVTWPILVASGIRADLGGLLWNSTAQPASPLALWRVISESNSVVRATSEKNFILRNSPVHYYVNDEFTTGDVYTSAIGDALNSGASRGAPKREISQIVEAYNLEPGDIVYVDSGLYQLAEAVVIGDLDAGGISQSPAEQVNFVGSTNPWGVSRILVSDPSVSAFQLTNTHGIRFSHLNISGATNALSVFDSYFIGMDWTKIQNCYDGISVLGSSSNIAIMHSALSANQNAGVNFSARQMGSLDVGSSVLWGNQVGINLGYGFLRASNSIFGTVRPHSYAIYSRTDLAPNGFSGDYNSIYVSQPSSAVGALQTGAASSARTSVYASVSAWALATGQEKNSLAHDPLLADPANGDFHLQSSGGRFSPSTLTWVSDPRSSPLIDAGHPQATAWTVEPAPNGRRLNIGMYGGSEEASKSPVSGWVTLLSLNDGGSSSGDIELKWTVGGAATNYSLCIEFSPNNGATWTNIVCGYPAVLGTYNWNSVPFGRSALGLWRAYCVEAPDVMAVAQTSFILRNGGTIPYYVNDNSLVGDIYCTAVGDDRNHGFTPDMPKASLQAILDAYELAPEDVVFVDAGTYYAGSPPISINQTDSGWSNLYVTIQGSTNPAARTIFQGTSLFVPSVFSLDYAVNIRLKDFTVRYGVTAISMYQAIGCELDGIRIENARATGLGSTYSENTRLVRSILWNNGMETGGVAVALSQGSIGIENSVLWGSILGVSVSASSLSVSNSVLDARNVDGRIFRFANNASATTGYAGDYNSFNRRNGALIAEDIQQNGGNYFFNNVPAWSAVNGSDRHSMTLDPAFGHVVNGDFHPMSPVGRYVASTGMWTNDAVLSPLVDAGSLHSSVGKEPSPNGEIINLGAYGGTAQASMTQTNPWLRVVSYNDEGVMSGNVLLYWLHGGMSYDAKVSLEYSTDYKVTWRTIASNVPAINREYVWNVAAMPLSLGLNWRVVYEANTNVMSESALPVVVKSDVYDYYVNDNSTVGDVWCQGVGLPVGSGANPTNRMTPVDSLVALLEHYPVGAGDRVFVDTGTYSLGGQTVRITDRNSGSDAEPLRIYGSTNFAEGGSLFVGQTTATSILMLNTSDIEINDIRISSGQDGIALQNVSSILLRGMEVFNCISNGVTVSGSAGIQFQNGRVWGNRQFGYNCIDLGGDQILNSTFWGNRSGAIRSFRSIVVSNCILSVTNAVAVYTEAGVAARISGDYNFFGLVSGASIATNSFERASYFNLSKWQVNGRDTRSIVGDPLFVNPAAGNFHLQSRGGYLSGTNWVVSTNTSWAIDAGSPTAAYSNETVPNGGRINMGAYGGTARASRSDTNAPAILPITLRDGGTSSDGQLLHWLYRGLAVTNTVRIEYSTDNGQTWKVAESAVRIDSSPFAWYSFDSPSPEALWRVVLEANTNIVGAVSSTFIFRPTPLIYFVNDDSRAGDIYTTAIGASGNRGYTPDSPLHSIQAVMERYPMAPGDELRVDTGTYVHSNEVFVSVLFSGDTTNRVQFNGSTNWAAGGSTLKAADGTKVSGFTLFGTRDVNLMNFRLSGFSNGVNLAKSARCTVTDVDVVDSRWDGIVLDEANRVRLDRVLIRQGASNAISTSRSQDFVLDGCVLWSNRCSAINFGEGGNTEITNSVIEASGPGKFCYESSTNVSLRADYNNLYISATGQVASMNGVVYSTLPPWVRASNQDKYSLSVNPQFADPDSGDFHPRSVAGRFQPGIGWVNDVTIAGRPDFSPLIDMAKPINSFSNEPAPRGTRRNIGIYGNTTQASKSNTNRWLQCVTAKTGGLVFGNTLLLWGYGGDIASNTIARLEYSPRSGEAGTWVQIADIAVGAGQFPWQSDSTLAGNELFKSSPRASWRISLRDATNIWDSAGPFGLRNNPFKFYINDDSTVGDVYTTAIGSDTNYGDDVDIPLATLDYLLGNMDLEAGDQVYMDTGRYRMANTNSPLVWSSGDGGLRSDPVRFIGSTNAAGTVFWTSNDFNTVFPPDRGFFFLDADYVDMRNIRFSGESIIFRGNGLTISNLYLTNRTTAVSLKVRGEGAQFKDIRVDRGSFSLSGNDNRVVGLLQRWGAMEIVGTNVVLMNAAIIHTNVNATALVANAAFAVVSNCSILAPSGTAVSKLGTHRLTLGHNILVAGGSDQNSVIEWGNGELISDRNNLVARNSAWIGTRNGKWERLSYWQAASGRDATSVSFEPLFQNEAAGDLHLNSSVGRWSPIRHESGQDPWDTDGSIHSPLIDLGDFVIGDEPAPHGWRRNLGAYGGTPQASKSRSDFWVTALAYNDGGVVKGNSVELRWAAGNVLGQSVTLQYSANGSTWSDIVTGLAADAGSYVWNTTNFTDSFTGTWRVVADGSSGVSDAINTPLALRNNKQTFYVNDNSRTDDIYCTAVGAFANNGLTPATPKATVQEILNQYDLEGGDRVLVDTGIYANSADTRVIWSRSGHATDDVVIQGNTNSPHATVLERTLNTNNVVDVKASYFQLRDMQIRGAAPRGILLESNQNVTLRGVVVNSMRTGVLVQASSGTTIRNSGFWNTDIGISLQNTRTSVLENLTFAQSRLAGIQLIGTEVDTLQNNIFIPQESGYAYDIGTGTSLLSRATMDYNIYDFSAPNTRFYQGGTNFYTGSAVDPLRRWQLYFLRDYRSMIGSPFLQDSVAGDFHPKSMYGRWEANAMGGIWRTDSGIISWAVDHGNPSSPYSLEPATNGGRINIGMYGNTAQASRSSTNVALAVRTLDSPGLVLSGGELHWPMVWSAKGLDPSAMVTVQVSLDGGVEWITLGNVSAYQEYWLWNATIGSQTEQGLWRVFNTTNNAISSTTSNVFIYIPIPFGITRTPYNAGGFMRFDWQGGLPGNRYVIRYSDDFGKTWPMWEPKFNGPANINMNDFHLYTTATNYIFEDRTSYLIRTRWYRMIINPDSD